MYMCMVRRRKHTCSNKKTAAREAKKMVGTKLDWPKEESAEYL